ncbi:hypothetical protein J4421_02460 [Candidatus Woesearchaeota archaeon]|nr:hypothetical protein [Candidatus Woesearchaeota archaeon]
MKKRNLILSGAISGAMAIIAGWSCYKASETVSKVFTKYAPIFAQTSTLTSSVKSSFQNTPQHSTQRRNLFSPSLSAEAGEADYKTWEITERLKSIERVIACIGINEEENLNEEIENRAQVHQEENCTLKYTSEQYTKAALDLVELCQELYENPNFLHNSSELRKLLTYIFLDRKRILDQANERREEIREAHACTIHGRFYIENDSKLEKYQDSCHEEMISFGTTLTESCGQAIGKISCQEELEIIAARTYALIVIAQEPDEVRRILHSCPQYDPEKLRNFVILLADDRSDYERIKEKMEKAEEIGY